jgi:hypothetical protein
MATGGHSNCCIITEVYRGRSIGIGECAISNLTVVVESPTFEGGIVKKGASM